MTPLLTPEQAAKELGIGVDVISRLISDGQWPNNVRVVDGNARSYLDTEDLEILRDFFSSIRKQRLRTAHLVVARALPSKRITGVYFVAFGEFVKIGYASDIRLRIANLETAHPVPLQLLHWERGPATDERNFHDRFRQYRHRGEWFKREGELESFLVEQSDWYWGLRGLQPNGLLHEAE